MFLEYYPGGDCDVLIPSVTMRRVWEGERICEIDLWAMFACLAAAMGVMARRTEDEDAEATLHGLGAGDLVHYEFVICFVGVLIGGC